MFVRTVGLGVIVTALGHVLVAPLAYGDEQGIVGTKLVIVDKLSAAGKGKLVFVSKDGTPGAIHKGPASDPPSLSGTVSVFPLSDVTGNRAEFALADGSDGVWLVNKETVAKYVNKVAGPGGLGVKVAVVKPDKVLKVVARTLGDGDAASGDDGPMDLDAPAVGAGDVMRVVVSLTVANGSGGVTTHRMCADFTDLIVKAIAGGTGTKIVSKTSAAPADCDAVTVTTTTTPGSSTTSSTIAPCNPVVQICFCDPFAQDCLSGFGCYPVNGTMQCLPAGSGGLFAGCTSQSSCAAGFFCQSLSMGNVCTPICEVGGPATCPSGTQCTPVSGSGSTTFGGCTPATVTTTTSSTTSTVPVCNVFTQNCPSGQGCYPTGGTPAAQCSSQGSGGQGSSCLSSSGCAAGYLCALDFLLGECRQICEIGGPSTCTVGTCSAVLLSPSGSPSNGTIPNLGGCS